MVATIVSRVKLVPIAALDYQISCVPNYEGMSTGYQLCSITYKCYIISLTLKLSVQMTSLDVKETCCICVLAMNSKESVTKGLVVQGR